MATTATAALIPADYGYIALTAILSALVNQWHGSHVAGFRKAAKIPYPNAYAAKVEADKEIEKYQFNCAQRAHANFLEQFPNFLVTLLVGGIYFPRAAAALGAVFLVGRVLYAKGYVRPQRDNGRGRFNGSIQYVGLVGNLGLSAVSVYKMLGF